MKWFRRASVSIPAPDGYHYGDDHVWTAEDQGSLIAMLENAHEALRKEMSARGEITQPTGRQEGNRHSGAFISNNTTYRAR